ncbi:oxysterol-binding protein 2 isoform X2 [Chelonia mydas]|uniref:oxysterol-binding protein 2 isoform X2 n=1 Tax=Chelonia mydas TaxID=8469 RepID=UPI001CA9A136|nr:oxysterol-binding protein 2 isoform X2 [Chelonia mydas]
MGRAAALCSGGTRGLVSVLGAVPCLACENPPGPGRPAAPAMSAGGEPGRGGGAGLGAPAAPAAPGPDTYKGWLFKWTNYLKGYQRRWFVLSNGLLSYYRTQAEMAHTCRGTINLSTAHIDTEDSCNIVLSNGGRTYHLKASSEVERQRWVTALELAKAKAIRMRNNQSDDSGDEEPTSQSDKSELHSTLKSLASKLEDLSTCNDLIAKHGAALQRSLSELENLKLPAESGEKIKAVNERATLFRITSNAMINACRDFLELAESHSRKWQRALQYEREQRICLEETIEQLAKQHNSLERACRGAPGLSSSATAVSSTSKGSVPPAKGEASDEDEETEYFDAMEDAPAFITVAADPKHHRRSGSNLSGASEGHPEDWNLEDNVFESANKTGYNESTGKDVLPKKRRRTRIPDKPNYSLNLWSIMKNCIGKELSKIPMPVNFNEPLSMLQRLTEDLEYHELLDKAVKCESSTEQMCFVAAFSVSSYSTTVHRTAKPFNPLLGETYELDRLDELGFRSLCEQVSHHPPAAAHHVYSKQGWTLWQEITIASKFRGKYLSIMPLGAIHLEFHSSGNHYVWRKVTSTVHNIIVGKLWIDQVTGVVTDADGKAHYAMSGTWDENMECSKIVQSSHGSTSSEGKQKTVYQTLAPKVLWKKYPLPENAENMYFFSDLALTLNEPEERVAPTDSRLRPDQRLMENSKWDEANVEKQRLEEKQRAVRRRREAEAVEALEEGKDYEGYIPLWFERKVDPLTGELICVYKGGYWEAKEKQDWDLCPDIF